MKEDVQMQTSRRGARGAFLLLLFIAVIAGITSPAAGQTEPGVTSSEIVLGGTQPFSGPLGVYSAIGKGSQAYFAYVNDNGGVNGRKITYKNLDGFDPAQTVPLTHQLVEQDRVFAIFNTLGDATNIAIRPYLNAHGVPQLFLPSGAYTWGADSAQYPLTIGYGLPYLSDAALFGRYIAAHAPAAKIGVLDEDSGAFGPETLDGLTKGLGAKSGAIVKIAKYELADPDVKSQVADLKNSGADTLVLFTSPKFATQALIAASQLAWKPTIYLSNISPSQTVMRAATAQGGPGATDGVISAGYLKDPTSAMWDADRGMKLYRQILSKYEPSADPNNGMYVYGMGVAFTMVDVLQRAGKDLTRAKLMAATNSLHETNNPFVFPGISIDISPTNRFPIHQEHLIRYTSGNWVSAGSIVDTNQ